MATKPRRTPVPDPAASRGCDPGLQTLETRQEFVAAEGLIQLSRMVQVLHGRVAEAHGLTQVQARMICILAFGPRGMAELAECLGVEKATLTGLVDRAERRGLVARSPVPGDRRALKVTLTTAGGRTATAFHADAVAGLNRLLSPLTSTELDQVCRAISKVVGDPQFDTQATAARDRTPGLAGKGGSS